jgi:hypothetical protein
MHGLLLVLRPHRPEFDMFGVNEYLGCRMPLGSPEVFLFEPSDNPHAPPFASVLLALQSQLPGSFDIETAGFFFHAVVGFEKTAGGKRKTADGIARFVVLAIRVSNHFAFK